MSKSIYKLPHPVRITATKSLTEHLRMTTQVIDYYYPLEQLKSDDLYKASLKLDLSCPPMFGSNLDSTTWENITSNATNIAAYKYRIAEGTIFTISDKLDEMLNHTDISSDIPCSYLQAPFDACFIELTERRNSPLRLFHEESGEHILEGAYLFETKIEADDSFIRERAKGFNNIVDNTKGFTILDIVFVGSPLGKKHSLDDVLRYQSIPIQGDKLSIEELIDTILTHFGGDADFTHDTNYLKDALLHLAKVLLFLGSKHYRETVFNERKQISKQIKKAKSRQRQSQLKEQIRQSYNRIIIEPKDEIVDETNQSNAESSAEKSTKKAHWRRGHFRMQAYGSGRKLRKQLLIPPMLIKGDAATKKSYDVKPKRADD